MRILLVDDESKKLKSLIRVLKEINGIEDNDIYHTLDLNEAKILISNYNFDLMILDLNMPEVFGEDPNENAGIDFIDEIIKVDKYIRPREIIVITAYEELERDFKKIEDKHAFTIVRYDENSLKWVNILKSRVKYALLCEKDRTKKLKSKNYDVAIITAVRNETNEVKRLKSDWTLDRIDGDPNLYYLNYFENKKQRINVVTVQQSEMGMTASATITAKLIQNYSPKYIIMVGIAAGIDEKSNCYGDIIIANEVWNYSSGKYVCENSENKSVLNFNPDPKSIQLNPKVREIINQDFGHVLYDIKRQWPDEPKHDLNLLVGPMACGTAVVANSIVVEDMIKKHSRKTLGLDMESYGMFFAANNMNDMNTIPICIKSISDFANEKKGDNYQRYAAYTSASFAKYLIENQLEF